MSLTSSKVSEPTIIGGVYSSSNPAPMNNQGCALQVDNAGNLLVNVAVGGGGGGGGNVTVVGPLGQAIAAASIPVVLTAAQLAAITPPAVITNYAAETGGNLAAIKADTDKIPAQGQALAAASMPVVLPAAQITTLTPPAAITNYANETGGNLAAIKASTANIPAQGQALAAASLPVVLTAAQVTALTPPTAAAIGQAAPLALTSVASITNPVTVTPPALTKATQGSTGFSTQDLKDAGRNYVILYAQLITGVTTEALATFTKNVAGTATTGQTAYTITSGKTFRIQSLSVQIVNTTTVANSCIYNVRAAASVAASSPIVASCGCSAVGAVAGQKGFASLPIPDGMELTGNGTLQIGVSHLENVTTASISSFTLNGYEY